MSRDDLVGVGDHAYLNTGTNGPLPRAAVAAMREQLDRDATEPRIGAQVFARWGATRDAARAALGRAVGAPPEQIALTSSTTQGVGLVTAGLPWRQGDVVLTTDAEHPGLLRPLDMLARRFGVVVRTVPAADVVAAIGPETTMVAVSHVLWTDGRVLPLAEIARAAHAVGASVLVDGAQSVGNIPVDVAATGSDYYTISGQKWLMGPQGSGGLWVAPDRLDELAPALPGYLTYRDGHVGELRDGAARFDAGSIDPITLIGLAASCEWVEAQPGGRAGWLELAAANTRRARTRLARIPGLDLLPGQSGLISVAVAGADDPAALVAALAERNVLVRTIPDTGRLRLSIGAWTTDDDIDAFAQAALAAA